jgi:hypothetical protein
VANHGFLRGMTGIVRGGRPACCLDDPDLETTALAVTVLACCFGLGSTDNGLRPSVVNMFFGCWEDISFFINEFISVA